MLTSMTKLGKLSIAAGILHLLVCIALVALGITTVWNKTGDNPVVPVAHLHSVWALLVGFTAVTAGFHLVVYPWFYKQYPDELRLGKNPWRFLEYGITASAMLVVVAILCGVEEPAWLAGLAVASAVVMLLGWLVEISETTAQAYRCTVVAWVLLLGAYSSILYSFAGVVSRDTQPPNFVYVIVAGMFVMFCSFGVVQAVWLYKDRKGSTRYEMAYLLLSIVTKTLLVFLTASGVPPLLATERSQPGDSNSTNTN